MNFFFNLFKKNNNSLNKKIDIFSPLSGDIINIEDVPDEVFSKKIAGDGIAILPNSNIILAPINGTIGKIFKTLHAFSIKSVDGVELFVHFGIDTVTLKGVGFTQISKKNKKVNVGDPIISIDLPQLKKTAKSILTPIIISNIDEFKIIKKNSGQAIAGITKIISIIKK